MTKEMDDVYDLGDEDKTAHLSKRFEIEWEKELAKLHTGNGKPSLVRALVRAHGSLFLWAAPLKLVYDFLHFVGPFAMHQLLTNLGGEGSLQYAMLLPFALMLQTLIIQRYFAMCFRAGVHVRGGVMSAVFRKALKLSTASRNKDSVGQMVNLLSVDANRIGPRLLPYAHMLWSGPVQIITAFIILYMMIGAGAISGSIVMILVIPLNVKLARVKDRVQRGLMQRKDERLRLLNELFSFIRQVKFFAWEENSRERIEEARDVELKSLRNSSLLSAVSSFLWTVAPLTVSCVAFATMAFTTNSPITPARVFVALALFNTLKFPLTMFPSLINSFIESIVAVSRLEKFLLSPEAPGRHLNPDESSVAASLGGTDYTWSDQPNESTGPPSSTTVPLLAGGTSEESGRVILHHPELRVERGSLVTVVGPVGSGKTSLLLALLGEMPSTSSDNKNEFLNGVVSYTGQTPWLLNATLRENILFGDPYDSQRYKDVLHACSLMRDLEVLPAGDETEIGEKGIVLSGGQKARVALARAIYRRADVYLFDDPLSAVDAHVGRALFDHAIQGPLLQGTTRILVTHQVQYLDKVDRVLVVDDGKIVANGSFSELRSMGYSFNYLAEDSDDEYESEDIESPLPVDESSPTYDSIEAASDKTNGHAQDSEETVAGTVATKTVAVNGSRSDPKNTALATKKGTSPAGKLMTTEERAIGRVSMKVYLEYFRAIGLPFLGFYVVASIATMAAVILVDAWLTRWTNAAVKDSAHVDHTYYIANYLLLALLASAFIFGRSVMIVYGILRAGRKLHRQMLISLLRSPVSFFDSTPVGRILNRFSKDQTSVDEELPDALTTFLTCILRVTGTVLVVTFVTWRIVFLIVPLAFFYSAMGKLYIHTSRELRRLDSNTKGPILSYFGETLVGVETVRAFAVQSQFATENERRIDENTKPMILNIMANRWLSIRLETVGSCLVGAAALLAVFGKGYVTASLAGLSISYALQVTQTLSWMVRNSTDAETQMNSVERVTYYGHLPSEAPERTADDPPAKWPVKGEVEFDHVVLKYRPELEPALKGISFKISGGAKVGIVGRTGAGKTSLAQALFRMVELSGGRITIDGVDTSHIGLHPLRSQLAIITQDPMLVSGSLRYNLDPFGATTDAEMWRILDSVSMKEAVQKLGAGLDAQVSDGGQNFSVGQRQLLCLARALLREAKVLVLDEATAAIDHETDELVQTTIRKLSNCTLITIAHRLQTVMDSDEVLVMDGGHVVEYGPPDTLLQNSKGAFSALVNGMGPEAASAMRRMAKARSKTGKNGS